MTPQLQAALDALNACPNAGAVADLLRRHQVRALAPRHVRRCVTCPLAAYFVRIGGGAHIEVYRDGSWLEDEYYEHGRPVLGFLFNVDCGDYPDLEAV